MPYIVPSARGQAVQSDELSDRVVRGSCGVHCASAINTIRKSHLGRLILTIRHDFDHANLVAMDSGRSSSSSNSSSTLNQHKQLQVAY
jgi:hypothetical protein